MDGRRFDDLARSLAGRASRRRLVTGAASVVLGGLLARLGAQGAACPRYGQPCTPASGCCNGAACEGGICRCQAGTSVCNTLSGPACVGCPLDSIAGPGCVCVCKT